MHLRALSQSFDNANKFEKFYARIHRDLMDFYIKSCRYYFVYNRFFFLSLEEIRCLVGFRGSVFLFCEFDVLNINKESFELNAKIRDVVVNCH